MHKYQTIQDLEELDGEKTDALDFQGLLLDTVDDGVGVEEIVVAVVVEV